MRQPTTSAAAAITVCILAAASPATAAENEAGDPGPSVMEMRHSRDAVLEAAWAVRVARRELGVAQARFDAAQRALDAAERSGNPANGGLALAVEAHHRAFRRLEDSEGRLGRAEDRLLVARQQLDEAAASGGVRRK